MEAVLGVLAEAHSFVISGEPKGYGWLLGIFLGLFYLTAGAMLLSAVGSIIRGDVWVFINTVERITTFFGIVAACIIPVLALCILYEVIMRYVFIAPTFWAFEVSYMMMGISLMLGIAFCSQLRRHIRVDFLFDNLPAKGRSTVDLVGYVFLLLPMLVWCSWGLFVYFIDAYKVNEISGESAWNPIIWPFKFSFAFGFFLFTAQTVVEAVKCVLVLMGREVPDPELPGGME